MIRVALIDDNPANRQLLEAYFRYAGGFEVIRSWATGGELQADFIWEEDPPDVVVVDLVMMPMSGEHVLEWIRFHYPKCTLIIWSALGDVAELVQKYIPTLADAVVEKGEASCLVSTIQEFIHE